MKRRFIVGAILSNKSNEILLTKMPSNRGVYPGQWGLIGGGIEEGETVEQALRREVAEESSLSIHEITPLWFFDETRTKKFEDGTEEEIYMVFLMFDARADGKVLLNGEWDEYAWVAIDKLPQYDLNEATRFSFKKKGWI